MSSAPLSSASPSAGPRVLVFTSCTGEKAAQSTQQLRVEDFLLGKIHVRQREAELDKYRARDLYTGAQHRYVLAGADRLRTAQPQVALELRILSAGYGLVHEDDPLVSYEATFQGMRKGDIDRRSGHLNIPAAVGEAVSQADLVFFLLGNDYLRALRLPVKSRANQAFVFLGGQQHQACITQHAARTAILPLVNADATAFGCGLIGLKGLLFQYLAEAAAMDARMLQRWYLDPQTAIAALETHRQAQTTPEGRT